MKKARHFFWKKKKRAIPRNRAEEQLFIKPKSYHLYKNKANKKNYLYIFSLLIIILIIIIISLITIFTKKVSTDNNYNSNNNFNITIFIENNTNNINITKYQNMLPRLTPDMKVFPSTTEEILSARQLYISDAKINAEYIKHIRPINETGEEKYKKRYSENETFIDKNLFNRRSDQYNYNEFCKLALEEKLIDNNKIEYDNKPIISVVIPSYNKMDFLLKSVRSIQNQKFKNIEIIIVNDCSTDNSTRVFNYLLESDPRVRIIHHLKNMGCWRTRVDGILYSKGQYVILFDAGDLYEDNYVLTDALNVIEKYNLDSCKFLFRVIRSFNNIKNSIIYFHIGLNQSKIVYGPNNIKALNIKTFSNWGNIWNRLVRANIYFKAFLLINEMMLNIYKNVWDDMWFNKIVRRASYSFAIFERIGYVYLQDGRGEGSPMSITQDQKSKIVKEYVGFLYYDYNFYKNKESKIAIVEKLREYNEIHTRLQLKNFREHFEVLNDLLEALIKDPILPSENKTYCEKLLEESKNREKEINKNKI